MADINIQQTQFALTTAAATNTQDITISSFGTVSAAILFVSGATANDTITADALLGVGFLDGTNECCTGNFSDDNVGTSAGGRSQRDDACLVICDQTGNDVAWFSGAFITDGVRLTVTDASPSAYFCTLVLIGGTDVANAHAAAHDDLGTTASTTNITAPGFQADLVFISHIGGNDPLPSTPVLSALNAGSFGVAIPGGDNAGVFWGSTDNVGTTEFTTQISTTHACGQSYGGATQWKGSVGTNASGFSVTTSAGAGGDIINYLALEFTNTPNFSIEDMTYPTSGSINEEGPAFQPGYAMIMSDIGPGTRDSDSTTNNGGIAIASIDQTNAYTISHTDQDAQATSVAKSLHVNKVKILDNDGSTTAVDSSGYSFDSLGLNITLTTNPASAILAWGFFMEANSLDSTAPVLTSPTDTSTGETTGSGTVSTDEGNGTLYWICDQSATPPSVAQIQAGQDNGGAAADASGNQAVSATGVQNVSVTGLTASTTYYIHYQQQDAATNDSTVVSADGFTTDAADVTAPVLTLPTDTETGATTGSGTVTTDEGNGTLYWVTTQSATAPSVAQVQAGQDHTSTAADDSGNQAVSATGVQNVSMTGLTASTTYYNHYQHQDAASTPNDSTVVSADGFTTATDAPTLTSPALSTSSYTRGSGSVSTNEGNGTLYYLVSLNPTEAIATVKAASSQAVSGTGTQNVTDLQITPGQVNYLHFVHTDADTNDSLLSTSAGVNPGRLKGTSVYSGSTIPANSISYFYDGVADAPSSSTVLTDAGANGGSGWPVDELIGLIARNDTDTATAAITDNDGTTANADITANSWDAGDLYAIVSDIDSGDTWYHQINVNVSSEQYEMEWYVYDDSAGTYSEVFTGTFAASGANNGPGTVALDTEGVPTYTAGGGWQQVQHLRRSGYTVLRKG